MNRKANSKNNKRIVPFLNYNVRSFKDYETISESVDTKKIIFKNTVDAISHSIENKKTSADIFLIGLDYRLVLNKNKWKESLQNAIDFFSSDSIEDYEACQKCKALMDKL
jgi:hypothetical protein